MKILDGLKGLDFAGIGADDTFGPWSSDSSLNTVPTPIVMVPGYVNSDADIIRLPTGVSPRLPELDPASNRSIFPAGEISYSRKINQSPADYVAPGFQSFIDKLTSPFSPPSGASSSLVDSGSGPADGWNTRTQSYGFSPTDFGRNRQSASVVNSANSTAIDLGVKAVQDAVKTVGNAVSSVFSSGPSDDQIRAATYPQLYKVGQKTASTVQKASSQQVRQTATTQGRSGVVGNKGSAGPSGQAPSSFTQDFNAITNGILQVFGVVAASKQAKQQARGTAGPRGGSGQTGQSGGVSSNMTYYLIGGGFLVAGVLLFAASRK